MRSSTRRDLVSIRLDISYKLTVTRMHIGDVSFLDQCLFVPLMNSKSYGTPRESLLSQRLTDSGHRCCNFTIDFSQTTADGHVANPVLGLLRAPYCIIISSNLEFRTFGFFFWMI